MLDHPVIAQRYFFPRRAPLREAFVVDVAGASLHCHRSEIDPGRPWLLHFHGNGEVVADWLTWVPSLHDAGYNVLLAEYRCYGGSTGEPALARMLDDALATFDALGTDDVVVYGRSVGSLYALHVAAHRTVRALVLDSGIASVHQRLRIRLHPAELGTDEATFAAACQASFDHRDKLARVGAPVHILHTRHDHMVEVEHAHQLHAWSGGQLVVFDHGDHNSIHAYNGSAITSLLGGLVP